MAVVGDLSAQAAVALGITQTVVGALAGLGGVWLANRLQRQRERDASRQKAAGRRNAVIDEIARAAARLEAMRVLPPPSGAQPLANTAYEEHAGALAELLPDGEFRVIGEAYDEIGRANGTLATRALTSDEARVGAQRLRDAITSLRSIS